MKLKLKYRLTDSLDLNEIFESKNFDKTFEKLNKKINNREKSISGFKEAIDKLNNIDLTERVKIENLKKYASFLFSEKDYVNIAGYTIKTRKPIVSKIKTEIVYGYLNYLNWVYKALMFYVVHDLDFELDEEHIYMVEELKELVDNKKIVLFKEAGSYQEVNEIKYNDCKEKMIQLFGKDFSDKFDRMPRELYKARFTPKYENEYIYNSFNFEELKKLFSEVKQNFKKELMDFVKKLQRREIHLERQLEENEVLQEWGKQKVKRLFPNTQRKF